MKLLEHDIDAQSPHFHPESELRIWPYEIKLLYHTVYWDGPLEGVCEWKNKKYYFVCRMEESATCELEPTDGEYVDVNGPVPEKWQWALKHYSKLSDIDWINKKHYRFRYMALYDLTDEEWGRENERHAAFRKYVGCHCDYNENGEPNRREDGAENSNGVDWEAYRAVYEKSPVLKIDQERRIVGYWIRSWNWNDSGAEVWMLLHESDKVKRIHIPKKRKVGEWVRMPSHQGFVVESDRLRAQIMPEDDPDPCMGIFCDKGTTCTGREWATLLTEPDPNHSGERYMLCHVCECKMLDCNASDLKDLAIEQKIQNNN